MWAAGLRDQFRPEAGGRGHHAYSAARRLDLFV